MAARGGFARLTSGKSLDNPTITYIGNQPPGSFYVRSVGDAVMKFAPVVHGSVSPASFRS